MSLRDLTIDETNLVSGGFSDIDFGDDSGSGGDTYSDGGLTGEVSDDTPPGTPIEGSLTPGQVAALICVAGAATLVTGGIAGAVLVGAGLTVEGAAVAAGATAAGGALGAAGGAIGWATS